MTYIAAIFVYFFFYEIMYLGPFVLVFVLLPDKLPSILTGVLSILFVGALLLASWRAHLAAKNYGNRDMGFWQAHQAGGDELRIQLSFLPVIGSIFRPKDKQ
jgi:hypothetical protein